MSILSAYKEKQKTALVVDDGPSNRAILGNMLHSLNFRVVEACDGKEGMEVALTEHPSLILMDLRMPIIDGFQATANLRQMPEFKDTIIIATSVSIFGEDKEKVFQAGCNDFLPKPVEEKILLALLVKYLKLEWTDSPIETTSNQTNKEIPFISPSQADLKQLYEAAILSRSKMEQIKKWSKNIKTLDKKYIPFANKVHALAIAFEIEEIMNLCEEHLNT
jgi:CheY-like chemotaxis protein